MEILRILKFALPFLMFTIVNNDIYMVELNATSELWDGIMSKHALRVVCCRQLAVKLNGAVW